MSFDSTSNSIEKEFPGLYVAEVSSGMEEENEKQSRRKEMKKEKKDKQKDKKDKGYMMFEEDRESINLEEAKTPGKAKKMKSTFKFQKKDIFSKSRDKDIKREMKEKRKDEKKEKTKHKEKKKSKHSMERDYHAAAVVDRPIFGVPLAQAVDRNKCHDGIELPALVRECIDYIEEYGLKCEGIYRISGVKSKVQQLKDCYNKGRPAYLYEHEPNVVASLLKLYLRELPEPVLTHELNQKFESSATIKDNAKRVELFEKLIGQMPTCNRLLLSWMIVHMAHIITNHHDNKMSLQNLSIVLSPTMQISHRVLNIFFTNWKTLFKDTELKRYIPPLKPASSKWSLELPDTPAALEEELAKQESLLSQLHEEMKTGEVNEEKHEQLWEVQRIVTQLKRKIKFARKAMEAAEKRKREKTYGKVAISDVEVLDLSMQRTSESGDANTEDVDATSTNVPGKSITETDNMAGVEDGNCQPKDEKAISEAEIPEVLPKIEDIQNVDRAAENPDITENVEHEEDDQLNKTSRTENVEPMSTQEEVIASTQVVDDRTDESQKSETVGDTVREDNHELAIGVSNEDRNQSIEPVVDVGVDVATSTSISTASDIRAPVTQEPLEAKIPDSGNEAKFDAVFPHREMDFDDLSDKDLEQLKVLEYALRLEEEELLAMGDELRQKLETEKNEIERLNQEIDELNDMRQDSDLEYNSSSSDSSYESEDEEDLQDILSQLIAENEDLEKKNAELCQKIHEERLICLGVKVQIRLIQQQQLVTDNILDREIPTKQACLSLHPQ